jgi:hypothetical protein
MKTATMVSRLALGAGTMVMSCTPTEPNNLDKLPTVDMTIKGKPFRLWVADESEEQMRGLMFVTAEQMAPLPDGVERGMIFVFQRSQTNSFWMKNTIIPLDIAYLNADGAVVTTYTMAALDDRYNQYPPAAPYRYVIELNANRFVDLGVRAGDKLQIPSSLLNPAP